AYSFDPRGNFSFGIQDYTDFPGMKYDPEIGVFGMDVSVSLQRPGWRVSRLANRPRPVPRRHRVSPAEGFQFMKGRFKAEVAAGISTACRSWAASTIAASSNRGSP